jgi:hypothetical protein
LKRLIPWRAQKRREGPDYFVGNGRFDRVAGACDFRAGIELTPNVRDLKFASFVKSRVTNFETKTALGMTQA